MTQENQQNPNNQPPAPYGPGQYPPNYYNGPYPQDDEIDLRELFGIIWDGKWIIIAITFVFAVGSVIYSLSLPNIYKAEATLAPTEEAQGQGLGGELGGLANLAGISVGSGKVDKVTMAMEILQSRQFIKNFVQKHNILPEIMAVKEWNESSGELVFNEEVYNPNANKWVRKTESSKQPAPTSWVYVNVFKNGLLVEKDEETPGLVNLSVSHRSPIIAHRWAEWLIQDINDHMRQRDIKEAQSSMEYLQNELGETNLSSMQQVFYQLIEKQIQTIMLANVRPEYVFQVLDPAVVPEQKSAPSRALICIVGTFLGGFLSLLVVFIRHLIRSSKSKADS
ncbi:Wzz/FepE/Etk N-terminal domain-containing protein [Idiomarina loihiensis]|uniref:Chain length determinant protein n=1 Tax=Idiomarina loihiensis (strain ATCC BAA-735 / DSM 15497 / L2-TR) TaxID=283942 RepID=Q5R093_IDILO|nr:Wzz/FepE/Etk N-terminal domain-containing protein [Idiomarina loihiensis]AAV81380.1 Chain length determinant protein [Idiomarina loihiensis L2TR]AGM35407.1 chain length determinant protein [Idiomarina loihiensis GSL 199]